ncbi:unnamed protein product [Lampetra planeri]
MAASFHPRAGRLVSLSNGGRTARRLRAAHEFNHGLVMSREPLRDGQLFQIRIDRKLNSWSGSLEVGLTSRDPGQEASELPSSATTLRGGAWLLSGSCVLHDAKTLLDAYGRTHADECVDLDSLEEGALVGVQRTAAGEFHVWLNGHDCGVAATGLPSPVWALIDLYGKCTQVRIMHAASPCLPPAAPPPNNVSASRTESRRIGAARHGTRAASTSSLAAVAVDAGLTVAVDVHGSAPLGFALASSSSASLLSAPAHSWSSPPTPHAPVSACNDALLFHAKCGALIRLSNNQKTAERRRPLDEFNNGVVLTNRPLRHGETFEIRIDRLVDKWSGSLEIGVTTHDPNSMDYPATMTNMMSGTIMMSGCGILTNGKGTRREYCDFSLDELQEGDHIGLIRKTNGELHFYVNGLDQGVAASQTATTIYGVVDLYGMAAKVTIVHEQNHADRLRRNTAIMRAISPESTNRRARAAAGEGGEGTPGDCGPLLFHPNCGQRAAVVNGGRTALRPNALEDFNHGVVLSNRPLRPGERFEVRIDRMVDKWAGSIEVGVTTHSPVRIALPSTMTNMRSGTWMMTGNGVMHNGTTILDDYGHNLDRLRAGDSVGVIRHVDGALHLLVNGEDQGRAVIGVPPCVYAVLDLYGQAAQATILDSTHDMPPLPDDLSDTHTHPTPCTPPLSLCDCGNGPARCDLVFAHFHGTNAVITNGGRTALRQNPRAEFNDAIVITNRPLRDGELFEIVIEKMVDRWSGSIEVGVTAILPEELHFPNTMTDIDHDTWMLSGTAIMRDGNTVCNSYGSDLDRLGFGSRIGMLRSRHGALHYFINGVDQGPAATGLPAEVYAVVDLYGQCAQVSVTASSGVVDNSLSSSVVTHLSLPEDSPRLLGVAHRLHACCGKGIVLRREGRSALRLHGYAHGLLFSAAELRTGELFEVQVDDVNDLWAGTLHAGLTSLSTSDPARLAPSALQLRSKLTWLVVGSEVRCNGVTQRQNYGATLDRLRVGNRVGVKRCHDDTMHLVIDGKDMGPAATGVPAGVHAVFDLYGTVTSVTVTSTGCALVCASPEKIPGTVSALQPTLPVSSSTSSTTHLSFTRLFHPTLGGRNLFEHSILTTSISPVFVDGRNLLLSNHNRTATRRDGCSQAVARTAHVLPRQCLLQVCVDRLSHEWTGSLCLGMESVSEGHSPTAHTPTARTPLARSPATPPSSIVQGGRQQSWLIRGRAVYHNSTKIRDGYGPGLDSLAEGTRVGLLVDALGALHLYVNGVDQGACAAHVPVNTRVAVHLYGCCLKVTLVTDEGACGEEGCEDREKADMVDGLKEGVLRPPACVDGSVLRAVCDYQAVCVRFRDLLALPGGFFTPCVSCFCTSCCHLRDDEAYRTRGEPPRDYSLPLGWVHFTLRTNPRSDATFLKRWHVAYHGASIGDVRRSLDHGELYAGSLHYCAHIPLTTRTSIRLSNRLSFNDLTPFANSLSFASASSARHCLSLSRFRDPKTQSMHGARVAFQVCVRPGAYKYSAHPASAATHSNIHAPDTRFPSSEIEWFTKERGSTIITALLIRVE